MSAVADTRDLLDQFLSEECTADVRRLLEDALADSARPRSHFDFNRFEITIEREANMAVIQDVLDATEAGVLRVPLGRFSNALERWVPAT